MKRLKIFHSTWKLLPSLDHSIPGVGWVWWELEWGRGRETFNFSEAFMGTRAGQIPMLYGIMSVSQPITPLCNFPTPLPLGFS